MEHQLGNELMHALSNRYQDGQYWDVEVSTINLPDDDPTAVRLMMHYFYHLDYPYIPLSGGVFDVNATDILPFGVSRTANGMRDAVMASLKKKMKKEKKAKKIKNMAWPVEAAPAIPVVEPEVQIHTAHEELPEVETLAVESIPEAIPEATPDPPAVEEPALELWPGSEPAAIEEPASEPWPESGHVLETQAQTTEPEPEPSVLFESRETNLTLHAMVYALAGKYAVQGLKHVALSKFKAELDSRWDTSDFLEAIGIIYKSTPESDRTMRNVVVEVSHTNKLLYQPAFKEYIRDTTNFQLVYDLLMYDH